MSKFVIEGGVKLFGEVQVQGSKNAALPVIAAALLTDEECVIENVPDIVDVRNFLLILKDLGAKYEFADHRLRVSTREVQSFRLSGDLAHKLRGSVLFAGPLLARFGKVSLGLPGGDAIGSRPIDVHLDGFRKLGAEVNETQKEIEIRAKKLGGAKIILGVTSVTGTENLILTAARTPGTTEIHLAATEPHVQTLCHFLNKMGAKIEGVGTPQLRITGVQHLSGANFTLGPDEIAAMTFCVAAAATRGTVTVSGVEPNTLDAPLAVLERMKVNFRAAGDKIFIADSGAPYHGTKIITGVYPQLLTDYQPLFGILATQAVGETSIHDWVYEGRQGYLRALQAMGAKVEFDDVHRSRLSGPCELLGAEIPTPDIRAGASIVTAALVAKGQSILYNAEIIDRGYEKLDERLRTLGANIKRVD